MAIITQCDHGYFYILGECVISKKHAFKIVKNISLAFLYFILSFLLAEVVFRIYEKIDKHVPFFESIKYWEDPLFGWKGKQLFGDASTSKLKIFIIGDSFTAIRYSNDLHDDEKQYFSVIKRKLNAEIFVYAGKGYGTTQEYLVLNRYFDEIKPDLIILQVCSNDFINNSWELTSRRPMGIEKVMLTPYLENDKIEYKRPASANILKIKLCYWRLFYRLFSLKKPLEKNILYSLERDIECRGVVCEGIKKSTVITNLLIKKMKAKIREVPMVAFAADEDQVCLEQFRNIFKENNIEFIEEVPRVIENIQAQGINLKTKDNRHWNALGHSICGEILAEALVRRGYFKSAH